MHRIGSLLVVSALAHLLSACGSRPPPADPGTDKNVGECCGATSCADNTCRSTLHCGNTQTPIPVTLCCEIGKYCCATSADCQAYLPGSACDIATSACFTSCATNDDSRCAPGFHCNGTTCAANLADGATCVEASDCASGNCSAQFAGAGRACAPAGTCAAGAAAHPVGYTLCDGNALSRTCSAAGTWSAETPNPNPVDATCDAGAGADSGFRLAAACTSGEAASSPGFSGTCVACAPFKATATACLTTCTGDFQCVPGNHCATSAGGTCATNGLGGACDEADPADCTSGRCDPDPVNAGSFTCQDKLANAGACNEDSDCVSGRCAGGTCQAKLDVTIACTRPADCLSGNCSADLDTATRFCAAPSTCYSGGSSFPIGYKVCSGTGTTLGSRDCVSEGTWGVRIVATPTGCDSGAGANSGFLAYTCTTGPDASSGLVSTCQGCGLFTPNAAFTACGTSCTVGTDAGCVNPAYCFNVAFCSPDLGPGAVCTRDTMCQSGRCDPAPAPAAGQTCQARLVDGTPCDENSDCISGICDINSVCGPVFDPSCPLLYAFDGVDYRYVTDTAGTILGRARFATRVTLYRPVYLVLPALAPLDGAFQLKIRETLPENTYLDEAALVSVDTPAGCEVFSSTSENTYGLGYVNPFALTVACRARLPVTAVDMAGVDVRPQLSALDDVIGTGVPTESAQYDLDFGPGLDAANAKLLIDGWAMFGAAFASSGRLASSVYVGDGAGGWTFVKSFGYPDGDLKTLVIGLDGTLRADDPRVRVRAGFGPAQKFAIDRVRLDDSPPTAYSIGESRPRNAALYDAGRASITLASFDGRGTALDDRQDPQPAALGTGAFTRYGDVTGLLETLDDMLVVMRHGDGVTLSFADDLPAPTAGTTRTHLLRLKVYYKEFETSRDADPLPFSAMTAYPPPPGEAYPLDPVHQAYRATFNTRVYLP